MWRWFLSSWAAHTPKLDCSLSSGWRAALNNIVRVRPESGNLPYLILQVASGRFLRFWSISLAVLRKVVSYVCNPSEVETMPEGTSAYHYARIPPDGLPFSNFFSSVSHFPYALSVPRDLSAHSIKLPFHCAERV